MAEPWSVIRDWKARCWNPEAPFQVRCCLSSEAHGPMQGSRPQINNTTCISKCAMSRRSCADPSQLCPCLVRRPRKGTMGGGGAGRNTIWKITEIELRCSVTDTIRKERNGVGYPHISGSHVSLHFNQSWISASTVSTAERNFSSQGWEQSMGSDINT